MAGKYTTSASGSPAHTPPPGAPRYTPAAAAWQIDKMVGTDRGAFPGAGTPIHSSAWCRLPLVGAHQLAFAQDVTVDCPQERLLVEFRPGGQLAVEGVEPGSSSGACRHPAGASGRRSPECRTSCGPRRGRRGRGRSLHGDRAPGSSSPWPGSCRRPNGPRFRPGRRGRRRSGPTLACLSAGRTRQAVARGPRPRRCTSTGWAAPRRRPSWSVRFALTGRRPPAIVPTPSRSHRRATSTPRRRSGGSAASRWFPCGGYLLYVPTRTPSSRTWPLISSSSRFLSTPGLMTSLASRA